MRNARRRWWNYRKSNHWLFPVVLWICKHRKLIKNSSHQGKSELFLLFWILIIIGVLVIHCVWITIDVSKWLLPFHFLRNNVWKFFFRYCYQHSFSPFKLKRFEAKRNAHNLIENLIRKTNIANDFQRDWQVIRFDIKLHEIPQSIRRRKENVLRHFQSNYMYTIWFKSYKFVFIRFYLIQSESTKEIEVDSFKLYKKKRNIDIEIVISIT